MTPETDVLLSRFTTIGTGGHARAFARPASLAELEEALRFAAERVLPARAVGLGSNLLAADAGVDALVLRLAGDLAEARVEGDLQYDVIADDNIGQAFDSATRSARVMGVFRVGALAAVYRVRPAQPGRASTKPPSTPTRATTNTKQVPRRTPGNE